MIKTNQKEKMLKIIAAKRVSLFHLRSIGDVDKRLN